MESRGTSEWDTILARISTTLGDKYRKAGWGNDLLEMLEEDGVKPGLASKLIGTEYRASKMTLALAVEFPEILLAEPFNLTEEEANSILEKVVPKDSPFKADAAKKRPLQPLPEFLKRLGLYTGVVVNGDPGDVRHLSRFTLDGRSIRPLSKAGAFTITSRQTFLVVNCLPTKAWPTCVHLNVGFASEASNAFVLLHSAISSSFGEGTLYLSVSDDGAQMVGQTALANAVFATEPMFRLADGVRIMSRADYLNPGMSESGMLDLFEFMRKRSNTFWDGKGARPVSVSFALELLADVNTATESFKAHFVVTARWPLSHEEWLSRKLSHASVLWEPPQLTVANKIDSEIEEIVKATDDGLYLQKDFVCEATIREDFELEHFPLDIQDLTVRLQFPRSAKPMKLEQPSDDSKLSVSIHDTPLPKGSGWNFKGQPARIFNDKDECELIVCLKIKRVWWPYFWRVGIVLAMICMQVLLGFGIDAISALGDRLGVHGTMFLAAVAYQFIISQDLPRLEYQTILDTYVVSVFAFITGVIAVDVGVHFLGQSGTKDAKKLAHTVDMIAWVACVILILLFHVGFLIYCSCLALPREQAKLDADICRTSSRRTSPRSSRSLVPTPSEPFLPHNLSSRMFEETSSPTGDVL
uniref:Uncharacterized protein n=1 Tax=Zooxanthella nutricula TaxID=1333877 RepID=A0A7S2QIN0_9DINO